MTVAPNIVRITNCRPAIRYANARRVRFSTYWVIATGIGHGIYPAFARFSVAKNTNEPTPASPPMTTFSGNMNAVNPNA